MNTRISRSLAFSALLFVLAISVQPAQAQLGVAAGLNFENTSDIKIGSSSQTVDNSTGYHFGVFFDMGAGPLAIRPGVFYRKVENIKFPDFTSGGAQDAFDLSMIDVPIDLRLRVPAPLVAPYVLAGPVFSFASSDNDEFKESLRDLTMSANIGAGVELKVPMLGLRVMPEIRYNIALSSYVEDFNFLGSEVNVAEDGDKMNAVMLRLNVAF